MNTTYQVRRYEDGRGTGNQMATGLTLEDAVEASFRLMQLQQLYGGMADFTVLPD